MTTGPKPETKYVYRRVLNFLPVLSEEQITKLRNMAIGLRDTTAFSEEEIIDLETKWNEKTVTRERTVTMVMRYRR